MSGAFTAKNYQIRKAPQRIELLGDKQVRPEPAQHIIEFPGGAIELSRTTDGCYWAHILIHRGTPIDDVEGYRECAGEIVDSRIDRTYPDGIEAITRDSNIEQIAVLIRPSRRRTEERPTAGRGDDRSIQSGSPPGRSDESGGLGEGLVGSEST